MSHKVRRSAHRNNGAAVVAVLLLAAISTAALAIAGATRHDTRTVVKDREVAGQPCIRINGVPSVGCDRLAKLLAETCSLRPGLCKETVSRALRSKSAKVRREAAMALGQGLAAAGIRGSITRPTVTENARVTPLKQHKTSSRERASTNTPTRDAPVVVEPAARDAAPATEAPSKPKSDTPFLPSVTTPSVSVPSVTTPSVTVPDAPVVTVPVPPEIPVVPPVTVPQEVPVPPVTIPDPLPGASRNVVPVCGVIPVRPCKPGK